MATSQNGYPVLFDNRTTGRTPRLRKFEIPGTGGQHLYLRDGSAGFVLAHYSTWWDHSVERLDIDKVWDEWGWAVRPVRGQQSGYSNHASGTAVDLNATRHPRGVNPSRGLTKTQIAKIRRRVKYFYRGTIRWGGDYHGTKDGMHGELNRSFAVVQKQARWLVKTPIGKEVLKANPGLLKVIQS